MHATPATSTNLDGAPLAKSGLSIPTKDSGESARKSPIRKLNPAASAPNATIPIMEAGALRNLFTLSDYP